MHDRIIDETCIDSIIVKNTDCFHKDNIIDSSLCGKHLRSLSVSEINHENSSFYRILHKLISVQ